MEQGLDSIYKCPYCGGLIVGESISNYNTIGAKYYSDLKQVTDRMPELSKLTLCFFCKKFFWFKHAEIIAKIDRTRLFLFPEEYEEYGRIAGARIPTTAQYFSALQLLDVNTSEEDERFIRIKIWQDGNDRIRDRKILMPEKFVNDKIRAKAKKMSPSEQKKIIGNIKLKEGQSIILISQGECQFSYETELKQWEDNCKQLLNLLKTDKTINGKLQCAELHRNLEEFDECIEILDNTEAENWIKDPMIYLAKMKIPFVVKLDTSINAFKIPYFQKRGELKEKQGDYQGALNDYDKAIVVNDKNPIFYVMKAGICEKLGNLNLSHENYDKALNINSNCSDAYINRALFYRRQRQYKLAQKDYETLDILSFKVGLGWGRYESDPNNDYSTK